MRVLHLHEISISPTHKVSCYRYYENNNGKAGEWRKPFWETGQKRRSGC